MVQAYHFSDEDSIELHYPTHLRNPVYGAPHVRIPPNGTPSADGWVDTLSTDWVPYRWKSVHGVISRMGCNNGGSSLRVLEEEYRCSLEYWEHCTNVVQKTVSCTSM
jgi:hypothetical protein